MLEVTDNFKRLSTANGREIECRIELGNYAMLTDADIISFDFNDVIHPDFLTFGTTCANRFHFRAVYTETIPLDAVIRPFVRFLGQDGGENSEWCPLGVFYITRRYARGSRVNVTAYDKMYRLDGDFTETELFPCTATALFTHLCEEYDIESDFTPYTDMLSSPPPQASVRDVIGFIAGLNGANAKFGRTGKLEMKKLGFCPEAITDKNCMSISVNVDSASLLALEVDRGTDTIKIGSSGMLSTVCIYNPFFTPNTALRLYNSFYGFTFYGAVMRTQAMPYFESGDEIVMQNGNELFRIVLSELDYHYDGGFVSEIESRQKNPIEEYVYLSDLEKRLSAMEIMLALTCYKYANMSAVTVRTTPMEILSMSFEAYPRAFIQFNTTLTVTASEDCELSLTYYLNSGAKRLSPMKHLHAGEPELLHLYFLDDSLNDGENILTVNARVSSGTAVIDAGQLLATITGQRLKGSGGNASPRALITEEFPSTEITDKPLYIDSFAESVSDSESNGRSSALQSFGAVEIGLQPISISGASETVTID